MTANDVTASPATGPATAPAFAAGPKTKADCEKAHMKWDDSTKKCSK